MKLNPEFFREVWRLSAGMVNEAAVHLSALGWRWFKRSVICIFTASFFVLPSGALILADRDGLAALILSAQFLIASVVAMAWDDASSRGLRPFKESP